MTVKDHRLKKGTLTLGATGPNQIIASCQVTSAVFDNSYNEDTEDPIETLCGDIATGSGTKSLEWTFNLSAIQDFDDIAGLIRWSHQHALEDQPVVLKTSDAAGATVISATVTVVPLPIGGEINKRLIAEKEWPCTKPTFTGGTTLEAEPEGAAV